MFKVILISEQCGYSCIIFIVTTIDIHNFIELYDSYFYQTKLFNNNLNDKLKCREVKKIRIHGFLNNLILCILSNLYKLIHEQINHK